MLYTRDKMDVNFIAHALVSAYWQADETPAIGTERCRMADNRCCTRARPHHTDTATALLASSTTTCRLQDRRPGFPVLDWSALGYLTEDCQLVADVSARRLRSADTATCVTRRTFNVFGDRCFAAAGPRLWNSLPINLGQSHSLKKIQAFVKDIPV